MKPFIKIEQVPEGFMVSVDPIAWGDAFFRKIVDLICSKHCPHNRTFHMFKCPLPCYLRVIKKFETDFPEEYGELAKARKFIYDIKKESKEWKTWMKQNLKT